MRRTFVPLTCTPGNQRWLAAAVGIAGLLLLFTPAAHAATVLVTTTVDENDGAGGPGAGCALREAIDSVNMATDRGGCSHSGTYGTNDTIDIPAGTYTLSLGSELAISNSVVLESTSANGALDTIIQADASALTATFRVFNVSAGNVTFQGLTIRNGNPTGGGGGIRYAAPAGTLTIVRSMLRSNHAAGGASSGGGLQITSSGVTADISASTFDANAADFRGGAFDDEGTGNTTTIHNCTIFGNTANADGGGVNENAASTLTLNNDTLTQNKADNDNGSGGSGGGIAHVGGTINVSNSIVAQNLVGTSGTNPDCSTGVAAAVVSKGFNLIGIQDNGAGDCTGFVDGSNGDQVGTTASPKNADLAPLANYGGTTLSTGPNLVTDPSVNMGNDGSIVGTTPCEATDQRGVVRPQGNPLRCDVGTLELAFCGDGVVCSGSGCLGPNEPEQCDDGVNNGTLASCCTTQCTFKPATTACDDGLFCTVTDTCDASGTCSGTGDPCANGSQCNVVCNEAADNCFDPSGTPCNDGLFCTQTDTCDGAGACTGSGDPCAGNAQCNTVCNEAAGNCFDPSGTPCNDGLFCTQTDTCDGAGTCNGTGDPCTGGGECANLCDEANNTCNRPAGTPCTSDGVFCNGTESCNGTGSCSMHSGNPCLPLNVTDANCATSCNEGALNCTANDPAGTGCTDAIVCNGADSCNGTGMCTIHSNPSGCLPHITMASSTSTTVMGFGRENLPAGCIQLFDCDGDGICGPPSTDDVPLGTSGTDPTGKFTITVPALGCPTKLYAVDTCTPPAPMVGPVFVILCRPVPLMAPMTIFMLVGLLGFVGLLGLRWSRSH